MLIARHADFAGLVDSAKLRDMSEFAVDRFGSPYSPLEVGKIILRIIAGWANVRMKASAFRQPGTGSCRSPRHK